MMNEEFKNELMKELQAFLQTNHPDLEAVLQTTTKNNGIEKDSIRFLDKAGTNLVALPVIYLADVIEKMKANQDYTVLDAVQLIGRMLEQAFNQDINNAVKEMFEMPDKSKVIPEVISREMNAELLSHTPHRVISDDIAVIARYQITNDGSSVITNELASKLCLTPTEVLDMACSNAHGNVQSMAAIMAGMMGIPEEQASEIIGDNGMYVVSNDDRVYGAASIFLNRELRKEVAEIVGGDFYIIPSSIHECICINADMLTPEEANNMILEVNAGELLPEEILSDHCYLVNAETLKISNPLKANETIKTVAKAAMAM